MARRSSNPYGIYKSGKRGGTQRRAENESIETLYFNYKLKRPGADTALITGMWPYIEPIYKTIIHGTWYSIWNRLWVQFLQHYMTHSVQNTRSLELEGKDSNYELYIKTAIEYVRRLFKGIPKEELKHIMIITVYEMATTYRHQGKPNFLLYFSMYYTHRLQSYIKPLIKDYTYYGTMMGKREPFSYEALLDNEDFSLSDSYTSWYDLLYKEENNTDSIDINWVMGYTIELDIFENLSRHDRQLLKWRYADNIGDAVLCERLGVSSRTVRRYLEKLRNKLQAELAAKHLLAVGGDQVDGISDRTGGINV